MNKTILAAGLVAAAMSAQATLIIDPNPGSLPGTDNVLFNEPGLVATGPLVQGIINGTLMTVDFFGAGEDLTTPPGGQARVTAVDGGHTMMTTKMTDPTLGIAAYQFNINAVFDGEVTIELYLGGALEVSESFAITGGGENWFKIYGDAGEVLDMVKLTSTVDMQDVRQNRIGAAPLPVPEPSALAGLGIGLAVLLRRRLKK